jgi:hypothetical protein
MRVDRMRCNGCGRRRHPSDKGWIETHALDADGAGSVRATLRRLFDGFELVGPDLVDGSYTVVPTVRPEAIRGSRAAGSSSRRRPASP